VYDDEANTPGYARGYQTEDDVTWGDAWYPRTYSAVDAGEVTRRGRGDDVGTG